MSHWLTKYLESKEEEVAGGWRRPYNEELHNLHASQNVVRVIKSRRIRLAGMQHALER
jgi:hypothetical protein